MSNRWMTYQKERFPLLKYSLLSAAFSYAGLCLSMVLRGAQGLPTSLSFATAFLVSGLLFAQLRIADEFKDYQDDCRYQPDRPVPRGLIKLKELGLLGVIFAVFQATVTYALNPRLLPVLALVWTYFALMSKEFFVGPRLRKHPIAYLLSHMFILVLIDIFITACDWMVAGCAPPAGLILFLGASFFNGVVIELGRKLRAPEDELEGVETYTSLWGREIATTAWYGAVVASAGLVLLTARRIGFAIPEAIILSITLMVGVRISTCFVSKPAARRARRIEAFSAFWILLMYVSVGIVPAMLRSL